jgi:enamine deaminase RidA (YjgF/YER057c/UK114 family)
MQMPTVQSLISQPFLLLPSRLLLPQAMFHKSTKFQDLINFTSGQLPQQQQETLSNQAPCKR